MPSRRRAATGSAGEVTVYDQLESLFLAEAGERQVEHLLSGLADSEDRTVILCVREDFLARLIERMPPWALPPSSACRPSAGPAPGRPS